VSHVEPTGPAAAAGIQSGDIIVEFNGKEVVLSSDLPHLVGRVRPGTEAQVKVIRNGKAKRIDVEIGELQQNDNVIARNGQPQTRQSNRLGIEVASLSDAQKKQWGTEGVVVKSVQQGAGSNAGLISGDVITMINGEMIRDMSDFDRAVKQLPSGRRVPMQIVRRGAPMFIPLRVND